MSQGKPPGERTLVPQPHLVAILTKRLGAFRVEYTQFWVCYQYIKGKDWMVYTELLNEYAPQAVHTER